MTGAIKAPQIKMSGTITLTITNGAASIYYTTIPRGLLFLQPVYDGGTTNEADVVATVQMTETRHVVYVRVNGQIPDGVTKKFNYVLL